MLPSSNYNTLIAHICFWLNPFNRVLDSKNKHFFSNETKSFLWGVCVDWLLFIGCRINSEFAIVLQFCRLQYAIVPLGTLSWVADVRGFGGYRTLQDVYRARLGVNRALLCVNRALLCVYRALLGKYRAFVRCAIVPLGTLSWTAEVRGFGG